jgi:flavin-binding protein dodecin
VRLVLAHGSGPDSAFRAGEALRAACTISQEIDAMSVAKVIEINASSNEGIEHAVQHGLSKAAESVKNIKGAWVNEIKVVTKDDGTVTEWRVNMKVNFVVD